MTSPIPPPTADVAQAHDLWVVDYKEGPTAIGLVMRSDYTIDAMRAITDKFSSAIQPQFTRSPRGLLLTAVQSQYRQLPNGPTSSQQLRIEYQDVSGFMLPKRLWVSNNDGRSVTLMDLSFGTCQAQRR